MRRDFYKGTYNKHTIRIDIQNEYGFCLKVQPNEFCTRCGNRKCHAGGNKYGKYKENKIKKNQLNDDNQY
jgi:hypothetical protein